MLSQTALLPTSLKPDRTPASPRTTANRLGIAVAVLLHLAVLLLALRQIQPPPIELPAPLPTLSVFTIPAERVAEQISVAPPPSAAAVPEPAKPLLKPTPKPKPRAVEKPLIAADKPAAATAPAAPAPEPAEPAVTVAAPPPSALTTPDSSASVTAAPVATPGESSNQRPALSPAESDRLERQYAGVISRMLSTTQKWPLMSKQMGETGTAIVRLKLARDGRVLEATLIRATGYARLDEEARAVAFRIGRFMPVPARLRPSQEFLLIDQPMSFRPR